MPLGTSVVRLFSFSVVSGAVMLAHLRRRNNRLSTMDSGESPDRFDTATENEAFFATNENVSFDSLACPLTQDSPNSTWPADTSLLRRALSALGGIIGSAPESPPLAIPEDQAYLDSMALVRRIAANLGLQSTKPESSYPRLPFIHSTITELKSLTTNLELLTFCSKFYAFLTSISQRQVGINLLRNLSQKMESTAIRLLTSDAKISPESLAEFSDLNLLMCLDAPPTYGSPVLPSLPQTDQFRQFAYCQLQFASFLSNLSVLPESVPLLSQECASQMLMS